MIVVALKLLPRDLLRHEDNWPLPRPVGGKASPDCHHVVKKPMGLETIWVNLNGLKTINSNQRVLEEIAGVLKPC